MAFTSLDTVSNLWQEGPIKKTEQVHMIAFYLALKMSLKDGSGRKVEATGDHYVKQNEPFQKTSGGRKGEQEKIVGVNEQTT